MKRVLVMIAAFLTACASVNVPQDYTLGQTNKEGLLVVSVSGEGLAKGETPVWHYRRNDGAGKGEIITGYLREPLDWNDPPGRLAYIALAPGRYEFYEAGFARQASPATTYWTTGRTVSPLQQLPCGFNTAQDAPLNAEPFSVPFEISSAKLPTSVTCTSSGTRPNERAKSFSSIAPSAILRCYNDGCRTFS
jgi:hypothetical protein